MGTEIIPPELIWSSQPQRTPEEAMITEHEAELLPAPLPLRSAPADGMTTEAIRGPGTSGMVIERALFAQENDEHRINQRPTAGPPEIDDDEEDEDEEDDDEDYDEDPDEDDDDDYYDEDEDEDWDDDDEEDDEDEE
ncbi:MAG: hypothetical protein V2B18_10645 [Pseudomonadota bacterium]